MQFSTVFFVVAAAAGLVSAEEPTTTTTLTSTLTQTVTITSCNPTVSDCPGLLATATASVLPITEPVVEQVTSSAYSHPSPVVPSNSYLHHGANATTIRTSAGGPKGTSVNTPNPSETGLPTGGAAGLRAEHGLAVVAVAALAALL